MRKKCFIALCTFFLLSVSIGLSSILFAAQTAPKTIKVSTVVSLTGPMAANGEQCKDGYEIYVNKINADGGVFVKEYGKKIPVELRILDDESDGLKTQTQLEVVNSWGAVANLGGLGCDSFEMGTPIAQKNKMVWIGPGCAGWMPHQLGNKWLFSVFMKTPFASPLPLEMIASMPEPKPNKIAIFAINQMDCLEADLYWREAANKYGMKIVYRAMYAPGTKDFSAMITASKTAGAEILLGYPIPPEGPAMMKQIKALDFYPKLIFWYRAPESKTFGPSLGPLADYVTLPVAWSNKLRIPGNDYVNAKYIEKHGKEADPVVGSAYSAAQVLCAAIEKAGTLDREAIRNAVAGTDMETVCGRIRFSPEGWAVDRLVLLLQWMGGERHIIYYNKPGEKYENYIPKTAVKWQLPWSSR